MTDPATAPTTLHELSRLSSRRDEPYPFYSDNQLRWAEERHAERRLNANSPVLRDAGLDYLYRSEMDDLLNALALTPGDQAIARWRIEGYTVREIAQLAGLRRHRVEQAILNIRAAFTNLVENGGGTGAHGWQSVYRAETRRKGCDRSGPTIQS